MSNVSNMKTAALEVNLCSEIDAFYQYRTPLERILTNLLDNALKYQMLVVALILILVKTKIKIQSTLLLAMKVWHYANYKNVYSNVH